MENENSKPIVSLTNDILKQIVKKDVRPRYTENTYLVEAENARYEIKLRIPSNLLSTNVLREEVVTWCQTWIERFDLFLADEEYSIAPPIDEVVRQIIDANDGEAPTIELLTTVGYIKKCLADEPDDVTVLYMLIGNSIATELYTYINASLQNNDLESLLSDVNKAKKD